METCHSQTHEETREKVLELVSCSLKAQSMLGLNCKKRAAKAILPWSCWGKGAPPALMFLQPEIVLQTHPRKEETRSKSREGDQEGPASQ